MTEQAWDDEAAERVVLGSLMLAPERCDDVAEMLTAEDFYRPKNATVYGHLLRARVSGDPTDPVGLVRLLAESGDLDVVGGAPYVHDLVAAVPAAVQVPFYARIVADWAARRRVRYAGARMLQLAGDLTREVPEVVDEAQKAVHTATVSERREASETFGGLLGPTITELEAPERTERGLSTGLGCLDDILGGLGVGQMVVIAARPGVGKSFLLAGMCRAAAMRRDVPTGLWSLEMSKRELMWRILSAECDIPLTLFTRHQLKPVHIMQIKAKLPEIEASPLIIDDTRSLTLASLRSRARRMQQRHGLGLIAVDYLQLLSASSRRNSRVEEVGEMSRELKILAGELDAPLIVAAQLNRNPDKRADRRPELSDIRESGSIEADADVVILLHRDDMQDPNHPRAGEIELIVAKHRAGPMGSVTASAQLSKARIVDMPHVRTMSTSAWNDSTFDRRYDREA